MSRWVGLVWLLLVSGCRLQSEGLATDEGLSDTAPPNVDSAGGGGEDALPVFPVEDATPGACDGKPDGTQCGPTAICVGWVCLPSICGDGFVGPGEDCDDSNTAPDDACPADCVFQCTTDSQCNDGNVCTVDTCDLTKHVCAPKKPYATPPGCTLPGGEPGTCRGTACAAATCGNTMKEGTEECDDGNTNDADGCKSNCTWTCKVAADCSDGDLCTGVETCNTSTHVCVAGTKVTCNDGSACTRDVCVPSTGKCASTLLDNDGDGFAATGLGACGTDCHDRNPVVRPNQTNWFPGSYALPSGARSFDYNCDGQETRRFPNIGSCVKDGSICTTNRGWSGAVPGCGQTGIYVNGCDPSGCKEILSAGPVSQECR